jgi:hypothetical protein
MKTAHCTALLSAFFVFFGSCALLPRDRTDVYAPAVPALAYVVQLDGVHVDCGVQSEAVTVELERLIPAVLASKGMSDAPRDSDESAPESASGEGSGRMVLRLDVFASERELIRGVSFQRAIAIEARFKSGDNVVCSVRRTIESEDSLVSSFVSARLVDELFESAKKQLSVLKL